MQTVVNFMYADAESTNVAHLAEVDEEGAGGSVHAIVAVAGVGAPHLLHPLRERGTCRMYKQKDSLAQISPSAHLNFNICKT